MAWRPHGHARVDPKSPGAFAVCDRCGQLYNLRDLKWEMEWRGPRLMKTGFLVCTRTCDDIPQQQLRPRILPPDPVPVVNPRPESYTFEDGLQGFTYLFLRPPPIPTQPVPESVYSRQYVLSQVQTLSGITIPEIDDVSGSISANQTAQALFAANPALDYMLVFNPTALPIAISFGTAALSANDSIVLGTGAAYFWSSTQGTSINLGAMTIAGSEAGQPYYAWFGPATSTYLLNDGGVLQLTDQQGFPLDDAGLPPGYLWDNGGTIAVVSGYTPSAAAAPIYFGSISAAQLLLTGNPNLPTTQPAVGSLQLWNNNGVVCVA